MDGASYAGELGSTATAQINIWWIPMTANLRLRYTVYLDAPAWEPGSPNVHLALQP